MLKDYSNLNNKEKLVYAYHILAALKLDDHTYTHLSARAEDGESFYIYPFGLRFEDVTINNLLRVNLEGEILEGEEAQYNRTGYTIHGSIYSTRRDINAIFHVHTHATVAVSIVRDGLMPISQWALHFYESISYHSYGSLALKNEHGNDLVRDLGHNYTMLLRHHGAITSGRTVEEAMFYLYHLEQACKAQCLTLSMNVPIYSIPHEICVKTVHDLLSFEEHLGKRDWNAWVNMINQMHMEKA